VTLRIAPVIALARSEATRRRDARDLIEYWKAPEQRRGAGAFGPLQDEARQPVA
jgi:hypothetical protein